MFVTLWRDTLLPPPSMSSVEADGGLPPPAFGTAGYGGQSQPQDEVYGGDHSDVAVGQVPSASGGVL